nr:hypothetical protein [uncultured Ruegeria sp.]
MPWLSIGASTLAYNRLNDVQSEVKISGSSKRIVPIRKADGDERLSIHGLRRTFRSGLTELGIDFDTAERKIAHKRPGLAGTYDKSAILDRRTKAQGRWEEHVRSLR